MQLLYVLEKFRVPVLNECMLLITQLGEETAFLVLALIVFWCVDKKRGYYLLAVGFAGTMINQFLKLLFRVPRPWILDPDFTILEQAREAATGYSFPSGHTQMAVGTFGALAATTKKSWLRWACIVLAALVAFSRMYIGVHTPADVLTSVVIAVALILLLKPIAARWDQKEMHRVFGVLLFLTAALMVFVQDYPFENVDVHNLESGAKNAYTMAGCVIGVEFVYLAERKHVNFDTKAVWWAQILKTVLGLGLVLLVKEGLRAPLEAILPVYPARAVRYFVIVVAAGYLWPMTFRWFGKLGVKK
ncbi:MAG: phosphatase PAP2 family protein [Oscillospiraceae bacterium]|nr:phosphatase PAP2 family protein [Oscillospiraceae bacterium]